MEAMYTIRNPEIVSEFSSWDYLRVKRVNTENEADPPTSIIGKMKAIFRLPPPEKWKIELFNSETNESISVISEKSLGYLIEDIVGLHQYDSREIISQVVGLDKNNSDILVWFPWQPKEINLFQAISYKEFYIK
ncbi:hypothetical protein BK816_07000 [Boudabousia tangfeifanii]|uniref:Uncharacterized protein n=1 Tax=Boudabousia tangfeifanii TaxID=1912795 RepID=A0A1D9MLA2_9ACTO|nr:hypothetical protein [Boudabousia tangfeifanii]AOZ73066.1 hypothetical protein BK816_07000 [Boudabousia tangfeifanii]